MPSTLDYVNVAVTAAAVVSYGYVFYTAMLVRRPLGVGLYRRHALGIALVAAVFALDQASNYLPVEGLWSYVGLAVFASFSLVLLYWVDSSILAARRSDPLYRDTFHWSRVRLLAWIVSVVAFVFMFAISAVFAHPSAGPPAGVQQPPEWLNVFFSLLFFFPIYAAAMSGVLVMPVAARRCKDLVFRSHLEWFFLFIVIQLVAAGVIGQLFQSSNPATPPPSILADGLGLLIGLYPLYMSVKRLVPLYKFSAEKPA
jgi:hypothetical protein